MKKLQRVVAKTQKMRMQDHHGWNINQSAQMFSQLRKKLREKQSRQSK
jgi:hypothetical protein